MVYRSTESKGFQVVDQIESTNGDNAYQDVYVANEDGKYSFEYYFMKDVDSASELFAYATKNLNANYKDDSSAVIVADSAEMTGKYEVSASDYYCVVWQNENSILYMTAYSNCKEDAKAILKDLGY